MTFELTALIGAVGVLFLLVSFQGTLVVLVQGLRWGLGSRDAPREPSALQGRAARTIANHLESLAIFAPLIITAHLIGISSALTVWGAGVFLIARIAFAALYLSGVPILRSAAWGVGVIGLLMIFFAIAQTAF